MSYRIRKTTFLGTLWVVSYFMQIHPAWGEFWRCQSVRSQAPVYTDSPTVSSESTCHSLDIEKAAFNKLPNQAFEIRPLLQSQEKQSSTHFLNMDSKRAPERDSGTQHKHPTHYTSWNAREISENHRRRRFTETEVTCELSGTAHGEQNGPAIIRITRGALTVDTVKIFLHGNYRPAHWKAVLKGECRNPSVEIL